MTLVGLRWMLAAWGSMPLISASVSSSQALGHFEAGTAVSPVVLTASFRWSGVAVPKATGSFAFLPPPLQPAINRQARAAHAAVRARI